VDSAPKRGRPCEYTEEIGQEICDRLAQAESLVSICKSEHMPDRSTVYDWIDANKSFADRYAKAKLDGLEYYAEEIVDIADEGTNDWMERNDPKNPGWVQNGEAINRSRLRVDTRKWVLSKLLAKRFGDKIEVNANVNINLADELKSLNDRIAKSGT
jgi:hypothetical protein